MAFVVLPAKHVWEMLVHEPGVDIAWCLGQEKLNEAPIMYYCPPEWHESQSLWLAWPFDSELWAENLAPAQHEFLALVDALKDQHIVVIFPDEEVLKNYAELFADFNHVNLKVMNYGDIWLRDTLPIMVKDDEGKYFLVRPKFNGWGQKYIFEADSDLSLRVAHELAMPVLNTKLIFEGGALEFDGQGTCITTEHCLLNANRNPGLSKAQVEAELARLFGVKKTIWLKEGLKNDHTDSHVDTIARFIAPAQVALMIPQSPDDPNYQVLLNIREEIRRESDAQGRKLKLIELPSPGAVLNHKGEPMPASYLNFIMGNKVLIMPTYNSSSDAEACALMQKHTNLQVIALSARAILTGGGAFHCISQEYFK